MNVSEQVPVLTLTHSEFIPIALGAHELAGRYVVGAAQGPDFTIHWAGLVLVMSTSPNSFV
jgi:hypothetical protein